MASFRGALRAAVQAVLQGAAVVPSADKVIIEYDWPAADAALPAISVSTPTWHHGDRSQGAGGAQFWSTVAVQIEYRAQGTVRSALVDTLDTADDAIESAVAELIVGPPQLGFRRIVSIQGELQLDSSGELHEGALKVVCVFEYANDAEPEIIDRLNEVVVQAIGKLPDGSTEVLAGADITITQD